jgi:hypothetical protein
LARAKRSVGHLLLRPLLGLLRPLRAIAALSLHLRPLRVRLPIRRLPTRAALQLLKPWRHPVVGRHLRARSCYPCRIYRSPCLRWGIKAKAACRARTHRFADRLAALWASHHAATLLRPTVSAASRVSSPPPPQRYSQHQCSTRCGCAECITRLRRSAMQLGVRFRQAVFHKGGRPTHDPKNKRAFTENRPESPRSSGGG